MQLEDFKLITLFIEIIECQQAMLIIEVLQALDNILSLDEQLLLDGPEQSICQKFLG